MSELKNCQCGCSKPYVIRHELLNTGYAYFNVACGECQITQTTDYPTEEAAITAWNTRTASPRFAAEEREAMETLVSFAGSAQKWMNMQNLNRSLSAIATVRKMLEGSV